jgi:hypothetical protein
MTLYISLHTIHVHEPNESRVFHCGTERIWTGNDISYSKKLSFSNSTEENPSSEANSTSASPQIPRFFWKRKVHPPIRKSLLLAHILSNMKTI